MIRREGDGHAHDGSSEEEIAEIRAAIERAREQVTSSALAIRREVLESLDWRRWVARRLGVAVAAAFAVGFLGGFGGGRGRRPPGARRRSEGWLERLLGPERRGRA